MRRSRRNKNSLAQVSVYNNRIKTSAIFRSGTDFSPNCHDILQAPALFQVISYAFFLMHKFSYMPISYMKTRAVINLGLWDVILLRYSCSSNLIERCRLKLVGWISYRDKASLKIRLDVVLFIRY